MDHKELFMPDQALWKEEEISALAVSRNYLDLKEIALMICERMEQPLGIVSGPISTGGMGDKSQNLEIFACSIAALIKRGFNIFNQLPFQETYGRLWRELEIKDHFYPLREFYLPIFRSGLIAMMFSIPGWEASYGAKWERDCATRLGIEIIDLPATSL